MSHEDRKPRSGSELTELAPLSAEVGDTNEQVLVRPLDPNRDLERAKRAFQDLSPDSRSSRFWRVSPEMDERFIAELSNEGPLGSHLTWLAVSPSAANDDFPGFGAASLWFSQESPREAEFTVTVADEWQRRGFATLLFSVLWMEAWELGIRKVTATARVSNVAIQGWWQKIGGEIRLENNAAFLTIELESPEDYMNRVFYSITPTIQEIEIAEWFQKWLLLTESRTFGECSE